jgi:glycosyltransferase involved in cell wall biosynthesis
VTPPLPAAVRHPPAVKLLVINYEYPPIGGGGGVICRDICEEIGSRGHEVTVITSGLGDSPSYESTNGVGIHRVPVMMRSKRDVASLPSMLSYVPLCVRKGTALFRSRRFDVINTHFAVPSGPAGHWLSERFRVPNVLTIHGGDIFDPSKALSPHRTFGLRQTVRRMLCSADRVVAQSSDTMQNARRYYGVDRPIDIVPLGIRPNSYPAKTRAALDLPAGDKIFVTIGRLVRRKNLPELLEIFAGVREKIPCSLLIIGDGPEMEPVERRIRELGLGVSVRMTGRVDEERKFQYLSAADIYLSTALHEGFGIVFLEAMECGLPIVCYNRGGQTDFLSDGVTGYLVSLGDKERFTERIMDLARSDSVHKRIGAHNKEYAKGFYIDRCADRYMDIFVAASSRSGGCIAT